MPGGHGQMEFTGHFTAEDAAAFERGHTVAPRRPLGTGAADAPELPGAFDIAAGAGARPTRTRAPEPERFTSTHAPDFIQPDEEPKLAVDYTRLVPMLIEAIKELTARLALLEEKVNAQGN